MMRKRLILLAISIPAALLILAVVYNLPPVHSRLAWRVDELRARVKYMLNPPDEAVFVPSVGSPTAPPPTGTPLPPTATSTPTQPGPTDTPPPTLTPTITPTPLPGQVMLEGVKYEDQHGRWNYCGPANLSMALNYWGWNGNRDVVGKAVKPNDDDKNIMPYEMQDFITEKAPGLTSLVRFGGDINLLKRLVAGGFPVVAEKGYYEYDYTGKLGWLGHYQFVTGYDDSRGVLIVQDTYIPDGKNHEFTYEDFTTGWRSFNFLFLVAFPEERSEEVYALLGSYADPVWAARHALEVAEKEAQSLSGMDLFFTYFNIGTSHVNLQEYGDATYAFDYAFTTLYTSMPEDVMRPYRMMWYQTWPYWAYYYSGRYQDVINLADTTLYDTIAEPVLEESFYWRGLAKEAIGDRPGAIEDYQESVRLNPNFAPGLEQLQRLGIQP